MFITIPETKYTRRIQIVLNWQVICLRVSPERSVPSAYDFMFILGLNGNYGKHPDEERFVVHATNWLWRGVAQ